MQLQQCVSRGQSAAGYAGYSAEHPCQCSMHLPVIYRDRAWLQHVKNEYEIYNISLIECLILGINNQINENDF